MTINPADLMSSKGVTVRAGFDFAADTRWSASWGVVDKIGDEVTRIAVGDAVCRWQRFLVRHVDLHERMAPKPQKGRRKGALMRSIRTAICYSRTIGFAVHRGLIRADAANSKRRARRMGDPLPREMGFATVNIVRREDVGGCAKQDGAMGSVDDGVISIDMAESHPLTPPSTAKALPWDAVGGEATAALAKAVADRGAIVFYGLLSGEEYRIAARDIVFRDVRLRGFWAYSTGSHHTPEKIRDLHSFSRPLNPRSVLHTEVDASNPLEEIKELHLPHAGARGAQRQDSTDGRFTNAFDCLCIGGLPCTAFGKRARQ